MPVQFPRNLVVAGKPELKKRNLEALVEGRALLVHAVQMPVDLGAVVKVVVTKQTKTMLADLIGLAHDLCSFVRQMQAHQFGTLGGLTTREKEIRVLGCRCVQPDGARTNTQAVPKKVASLMNLLSQAHPHFFPVHAGQARQLIVPRRGHRFSYLTLRRKPVSAKEP